MQGTVLFYDAQRRFGRIQPDGAIGSVFVHVSGLAPESRGLLAQGDRVHFETEPQLDREAKAVNVRPLSSPPPPLSESSTSTSPSESNAGREEPASSSPAASVKPSEPSANCFVVMPFGRTPDEIRWFSGWYQLVIDPAVRAASFEPILAAAQERPDAINDEIRAHLAFDPMVVVDLGGLKPESEPNPNVMYELGLRHAFNLPHVIMAWAGQRLPFDISNQRTIMERRDLIDVPVNRQRLEAFLREARSGNYYRPMDAVGRAATLDAAEQRLGTSSVLGVLVQEVRDLRARVSPPAPRSVIPLKKALGERPGRRALLEAFTANGGTLEQWSWLMGRSITPAAAAAADKLALLFELARTRWPNLEGPRQLAPPDAAPSSTPLDEAPAPKPADEPGSKA